MRIPNVIKKNKQELIVVSIFMFFAFGFNVYRVESDGCLYYRFLEYILHLPNPESFAAGYYNPGFQQAGSAYFNLPFYLPAYFIERLLPHIPSFNGITLRQIAINLASNFYVALSLILVIRVLKQLNFKYKILPVLSVLFSTTAFAAAVVVPSFNHAVDIFITTLFVYLFLVNQNKLPRRDFLMGVVYVLAVLVRYFNFVFILPALIYLFTSKEYKRIKYFIFGIASSIWIIPLVFYLYNGSFLASAPHIATPADFFSGSQLAPIYIFKYLLHPLHGLFIWSPVTALSLFGLLYFSKVKQSLGYTLFAIWFFILWLYGYFPGWSAGWSFSNRYLVSLFPIYIIGLAAFLERYKRIAVYLILAATIYSVILYLNWRLNIMDGGLGTPWNAVESWLRGEAVASLDKKLDFGIFWHRLYETCRYKYLLKSVIR